MQKLSAVCVLMACGAVGLVACNGLPGLISGGGLVSVVSAFLPDSISLDVSEMPDDEDASGKAIVASMPRPGGGPFERTLHSAARVVHGFHRFADHALALGAMVKDDMTSPDQTQVAGTLTRPGGRELAYKVDFAAFDFDGDGTADGSGNAVETPVAMRMWVDSGNGYQRHLCALVTVKPSADNLGAGQCHARPGAARPDAPGDLQLYVQWDRTGESHKWNESFLHGSMPPGMMVEGSHARVDLRTSGETIEKTVRSSSAFAANPHGLENISSAVHFLRGSGHALMSASGNGSGGPVGFSDVCLNLATLQPVTGGECDAFDTQDMAFIGLPVGGETDFPADFPEQPTF